MAKKQSKRNPWRGFQGFWIMPDGSAVEVRDHFETVKDDPTAFGFSPTEFAYRARADRETVLREAMKRGSIRVRGHNEYTTFEFHKMDPVVMKYVKRFMDRQVFYPDEVIHMHELATKKSWEGDYRRFRNLSESTFHELKG